MRTIDTYTTTLTHGVGVIDETLLLLPHYKPGMGVDEFADYVISNGILPSNTNTRIHNIVDKIFFYRYVNQNSSVPKWLLQIRRNGLMLDEFRQILMIYCARVHRVYYEFIIYNLNTYRRENTQKIKKEWTAEFVKNIVVRGDAEWSDYMQNRNARNLRTAMQVFDQINSKLEILPYRAADSTILYLMHELHFSGLSDVAIVNDTDWLLLGLDKEQVIQRILDLNMKGGFIAQRCADLITISWNYKTMEEFINAAL